MLSPINIHKRSALAKYMVVPMAGKFALSERGTLAEQKCFFTKKYSLVLYKTHYQRDLYHLIYHIHLF